MKIEKPNFERINYSLRPAKHVERKMFCEAFSRLSVIDDLRNYRYIGMGSAYFSDFILFHRQLGLTKMTSIEGEDGDIYKRRINFNKPFSCIEMVFGYTTSVLPKLPWIRWAKEKEKSIVWLDYVDSIMEYMLGDIDEVVGNITSGSLFLLSVNIEEENQPANSSRSRISTKDFRMRKLEENLGKRNVPSRAYRLNLNVNNNKSIVREIINTAILNALQKRNYGIDDKNQLEYRQLFNIYYRDSADMLTVGGIIYDRTQRLKVEDMFDNLEFIKTGDECFDIIIPKLTHREIQALDKLLPNEMVQKLGEVKNIPLSPRDVINYAKIYRYFPTFAETHL